MTANTVTQRGTAPPPSRTRPWPGAGSIVAVAVLAVTVWCVGWPETITSLDPVLVDLAAARQPPGAGGLLGTDQLGRDLMARIVYGARPSLGAGAAATALGLMIGVPLGVVTGYLDRYGDEAGLRFLDILSAFPSLLLSLVVIAIVGPGQWGLVLAIGIAVVPTFARLTRAETRLVRRSGYVAHARTLGIGIGRVVARHVIPNVARRLPSVIAIVFAGAVLAGASLTFLGLGSPPPSPEWGALLADGRNELQRAWWIAVFPGIVLAAVVLAVHTVGQLFTPRSNLAKGTR